MKFAFIPWYDVVFYFLQELNLIKFFLNVFIDLNESSDYGLFKI